MSLARAFDAAGMPDSAIVHYEHVASGAYPYRMMDGIEPLITPMYVRRLGELYEARNDYAKAAEDYRRFIALWAKAEPEFQPLVDVRARIRRLADTERR